MKLPPLLKEKEIWLKEFDHWITPYLDEVRDSLVFHRTMQGIKEAIELLGEENSNFKTSNASSATRITKAVLRGLSRRSKEGKYSLILAFCDLLFLVTGKTDNNFKCQFPVYIKEYLRWTTYPSVKANRLKSTLVPRIIKTENVAQTIIQLDDLCSNLENNNLGALEFITNIKKQQYDLLFNYFDYILNQDIYLKSLDAFGSKYFELKTNGREEDILAPIIVSYVRGSASASGGHKPESLLRELMNSWGLHPNEDYNVNDVNPIPLVENAKSRAYDFVLPYNVKSWNQRIFIQSQFYAGDSGSVSHKNVDQTTSSRLSVKRHVATPLFVEYVDGAGYYGSLNGDLRKLLFMEDTEMFIQVRSSPVKLRQLFQMIHYLIPIELVHALALNNFNPDLACEQILKDGYTKKEFDRVLASLIERKTVTWDDGKLNIHPELYGLARKYYLLDCIVLFSHVMSKFSDEYIYIPGYEEFRGAKLSSVLNVLAQESNQFYIDWQTPQLMLEDLEYLVQNKWVICRR